MRTAISIDSRQFSRARLGKRKENLPVREEKATRADVKKIN